jgi:endonuclease III
MPTAAIPLKDAIRTLRTYYGRPEPPSSDPFELVLLENIAYLGTPARRREAFDLLRRTVGTAPAQILGANRAALERVTASGILKSRFASKLRDCAQIAMESSAGDLAAALRREPIERARRLLRRFPGIGAPGADKVLLFSGHLACLAPESNALRVLVRLGCIGEDKSYARMYRAGVAAGDQLAARILALRDAHLLLHRHGETLCKRSAPRCAECPLVRTCAYTRTTRAIALA